MSKKQTQQSNHLSKDVSLGALLACLLGTAYMVVIPSLVAMQEMPQQYYNLMAVSDTDSDRDGIADHEDVTPFGARSIAVHAASDDGITDESVEELSDFLTEEEMAELTKMLETE